MYIYKSTEWLVIIFTSKVSSADNLFQIPNREALHPKYDSLDTICKRKILHVWTSLLTSILKSKYPSACVKNPTFGDSLVTAFTKRNIHVPLTHWGRDEMDNISQTTFSNAFSWIKMFEFRLKFYWSLFVRVQLKIFRQIIAWCRPGHKPFSEQMIILWTDITRPQWGQAICFTLV